MRPSILNSLFSDVLTIAGVGPRIKELLSNRIGTRIIDLATHLPTDFVDRRTMPDLTNVSNNSIITSVIEVEEYISVPHRSKRPLKVICRNDTGYLTLVFFNANSKYLSAQLPVKAKRVVSGKVEYFDGTLQMIHPDHIAPLSDLEKITVIEPTYPLTHGITQKTMRKIINNALETLPDLPEWIEENFKEKQGWSGWKESLQHLHSPKEAEDLAPTSKERSRLAYDELLANQLALALSRGIVKRQLGREINGDGNLRSKLIDSLPFSLTKGQEDVLKEVITDMNSEHRMIRLLQGDVGSGKTVVALIAMLNAVEAGSQTALMAPTEILSRQHASWISQAISEAGLEDKVKVRLLTGSDKGKKREEILEGLKTGEVNIIVGTHALFQENVEFKDLAMVTIDEQHRFGVKQRLSLTSKGDKTDLLLMTATPIPRTLTLTLYGDMEISSLKEKPKGRKEIETSLVSLSRINEVVDGLKRAISEGNRIYWVCPLIEESEELDLAAVEERFKDLQKIFKGRVGLVHGRVKAEEKEQAINDFDQGNIDILVATTVIEVGVDVPEATIMVVEHAERFGLSQLHQLRGRVGRNSADSNCILLYSKSISEVGKRRLKILRETNDGFKIAEEDLVLRGSGEVLGTKQSGMPDFKLAIFPEHSELLFAARDDTKLIIETDPELKADRGEKLRTLLYLYEYDHQIKYLMS